ncbi:MAG: hypothetical protein ABW292_00185, partial [Vicinamibacterales bacterium]
MRRFSLGVVFLVFSFVAGLVLTGRMRTAEDANAQASRNEPVAATPSASQARTVPTTTPAAPDLTVAAQLAIPSVPHISSTQVVRTPNSPFANDPF